jgi:hypothetical protein
MTLNVALQFGSDGFAAVPSLLSGAECDVVLSHTQPHRGAAGSRCMLVEPWCVALARRLRAQPVLSGIVPPAHVAVQCTYFERWRGTPRRDLCCTQR